MLKAGLAAVIKAFMGICILLALLGIPYFVIGTTWNWLVRLWYEHPVWCVLLFIPIIWLAYRVMKWALGATGHLMMGLGSIVDKLER